AKGPTLAVLLGGLRRDRLKELCRALGFFPSRPLLAAPFRRPCLPPARGQGGGHLRAVGQGGGHPRTPGRAPCPRWCPSPSRSWSRTSGRRPTSSGAARSTGLTGRATSCPSSFFKRICDVWDEEYQEAVTDMGADFADSHRFQVPEAY